MIIKDSQSLCSTVTLQIRVSLVFVLFIELSYIILIFKFLLYVTLQPLALVIQFN